MSVKNKKSVKEESKSAFRSIANFLSSKPTETTPASINDINEKEDVVTKTVSDSPEDDMDKAKCDEIWLNACGYISQHERDSLPDHSFMGGHKSFPLRGPHDIANIARLLHHSPDPSSVKRKTIETAKKNGWTKFLPESWLKPDEKG